MATSRTLSHAGTLPHLRELLARRLPMAEAGSARGGSEIARASSPPGAADFRVTRATGVAGGPRWPRLCLDEHWTLVGPEYFLG